MKTMEFDIRVASPEDAPELRNERSEDQKTGSITAQHGSASFLYVDGMKYSG